MEELRLTDLIEVQILQQIQDGFSGYTGMAALTTDADGVPVTNGSGFTRFCMELTRKSELGAKRCEACDKNGALHTLKNGRVSVYYCHAGLIDFAAPIMVEGKFIGSFIGGQVRPPFFDEAEMRKKAEELGIDPEEYLSAAKQTIILDMKEIEKAAEFLKEIADVLSGMAYRNYVALMESRKLERIARSQSEYIMDMNLDMQKRVKEWIGIGEQALETQDSRAMEQALKKMIFSAGDIYSLVEDSIQYIQLSEGKAKLTESEYDIRELFRQIVNGFEQYHDKDPVHVEIDTDVPEVLLGDSGRIGQIITKLLQILKTYQEQETIEIRVNCKTISYATMIEIEIQLRETELREEKLEDIRNGLKGNDDYVPVSEELGGISFAGMMIRQMSGKVNIESDEHVGTVLEICLPQLNVKGGGESGI